MIGMRCGGTGLIANVVGNHPPRSVEHPSSMVAQSVGADWIPSEDDPDCPTPHVGGSMKVCQAGPTSQPEEGSAR
jgi:hypothetical protein